MKEAIKQALRELTQLNGAPGFEQSVVQYLASRFEETGAFVSADNMGNLYASLGARDDHPHLLISAHSDEIGGIVKFIDENGFLRIDPLGGVSDVLLVGRRVWVGSQPGVVGTRPGHLPVHEGQRQVPPIDQLYIDVGASSAEEVAELGIQVGSPVTYDSPLQPLANPDRLNGKAIDNRLGCAVVLQLFRELRGQSFRGRLTGLVTVQEEVGGSGATVAARRVEPDCAVVVDTLPVGDTPEVPRGRMPGMIGRGPVLVLASSGIRGWHMSHPKLTDWMTAAASAAQVPLQLVSSIGYAVTDARVICIQNMGIPTAVLGLPRRYSHSPICTFDINDAVSAVLLLQRLVETMADRGELGFL